LTRHTLAAAWLAVLGTQYSVLGPAAAAEPPVDFNRQVLPILSDNCFACHGPDAKTRKARLRLDTREGAFAELRSGDRAVVPGKPDESALVERITAADDHLVMPPPESGKALKKEEVELLRRWIAEGAEWKPHWAFVPPARPDLPAVKGASWVRNPIDRFVLARLEREGLTPAPEADRVTLIRRVTLDLTGLPPTPAEVDAFLADTSPDAYEKVVDRLLASPRYGEHRARYWLDAARYGDTHGLHLDNFREIWPYRDWVIRAFNENKPFDRFVIEQVAGDLLPDATLDQVVATGFNRCHVTTSEGGSIEEEVYVRNVVDRVDTTGTVFLGLTVGCARCHDHKYDPVTQKDYYALFAFFNSIDGPALDGNAARHAPVVRVGTPEQLKELEEAQARVAEVRRAIATAVAETGYDPSGDREPAAGAVVGGVSYPATSSATLTAWMRVQRAAGGAGLPREIQTLVRVSEARRTREQTKQLRDHFVEHVHAGTRPLFNLLHRNLKEAEAALDRIDKALPATLVYKEAKSPRPAYVLKRGEYDQRGEKVDRGTPAFLPPLPADAPPDRLGFARWLVAAENPLTARTAVNRFWQEVFGTGIVRTAEDLGVQGEPPSHPELLDWLAVEFRESGWDVKRFVKLLVTSAAYRQSAAVTREKLAKDRDNRLLSRGPRFRLDAETLRDQAFFVGGLLVEKVGGPSVKPPQPAGLWEAVGYTGSNTYRFAPDTGPEKVHRRSLYTFWKRTAPPPQMTVTDAPSREACVVRRERTNTPLQALLLMNETQYVEAARALAGRALREGGGTDEARLTHLFRLTTARPPDADELQELKAALADFRAAYARDAEAAKKLIAVGETKPDPKLDPAELAAWTMVGNTVLNLDEVLNK
jgi:mono/diheme cytochrome c family protein